MARIFEDNLLKGTPDSLSECTDCPPIAQILWSWARFLEIIGIVLFWLLTVAGFITGLVIGLDWEDFLIFLAYAGGGLVSGIIEYFSCFIIALGLGALASIVYDTSISANVAIYSNKAPEQATPAPAPAPAPTPAPTPAPKVEKPQAEARPTDPGENLSKGNTFEGDFWVCGKCGKRNTMSNPECWNCENKR